MNVWKFCHIDVMYPHTFLSGYTEILDLCYWVFGVDYTTAYSPVFPTDSYLWRHIYANSFSASRRRCWSGRDRGFPGNAVHKAALCSQMLLYQTLHTRWNENDIHFLKTVGFLQKYSDIKTPAPGFDFETCSAHVYSTKSKPFGKSICGCQFWYCDGRHK